MATLTETALNGAVTGFTSTFGYLAIHTEEVATTGNESTATRMAITLPTAADGEQVDSNILFEGGAANGPAMSCGFWTELTDGELVGSEVIVPVAPETETNFNAEGKYQINTARFFAEESA